ncbi:MAG: UDP-N-acetylglucosamine 2-epimerase (non-hydrolyzing) [Clostridia bacterium]|nr:UDP-N-acetylglucosamine 2-epimerase (non-hydrolyzing) [Clostridia bacterium]
MSIKVMLVFGTRPEAIKMAPLYKALKNNSNIDTKICVTAQHREMLDQVMHIFNLVPDYDLDIMEKGQTLAKITSKALEGLCDVFEKEKPDLVLVHGDTTTTFVASLAAFYNQIKVGHVEAGLRTYDKYAPYPEEINRKLTTALADIYFAPTENNKLNLLKENIDESKIYITGNTAVDAMKYTVNKEYNLNNEILNDIDFVNKKIILVTAHRRENLGEPLENICEAINVIVNSNDNVECVYPVHLNPIVQDTVRKILGNNSKVHLIDPLDAMTFQNVMDRSYMVMSDSGGVQEEAPSVGKPVLVLRSETERPEAIKTGTLKLAGTDRENIIKLANELLNDRNEYERMSKSKNPYGDGNACERIVNAILYEFNINTHKPDEFKI